MIKAFKKCLVLMMTAALVFTNIGASTINAQDLESSDIKTKTTQTYVKESNEVNVFTELEYNKEEIEIKSVTHKDGNDLVLEANDEGLYGSLATENGDYNFVVKYTKTTTSEEGLETTEELEHDYVVSVDKILSKEELENQVLNDQEIEKQDDTEKDLTDSADIKENPVATVDSEPDPIENSKGDKLLVTFNRDNSANLSWEDIDTHPWNYYDEELVEISINFSEQGVSKRREVEIEIPKGLEVLAYSAKLGTESKVGEQILNTTTEVEQSMITSEITSLSGIEYGETKVEGFVNAETRGIETVIDKSARIKYTFNDETPEEVTLTIKLGVQKEFYDYSEGRLLYDEPLRTSNSITGTGKLTNQLKVLIKSGLETLGQSINTNIKDTWKDFYNHKGIENVNVTSTTIDPITNQSPDINPFGRGYILYRNQDHILNSMIEELVITYAYPDGAEYIGYKTMNYITKNLVDIEHDENSRIVKFTYKDVLTYNNFKIIPDFPTFKLSGDIYNAEDPLKLNIAKFSEQVAIKHYNSDKYQISSKNFDTKSVLIIKSDQPIGIESFDSKSYNHANDNYKGIQFLGNFRVKNESNLVRENLKLDWVFEGDLAVRSLRLGIPTNSSLMNITVYTNERPDGFSIPNIKTIGSGQVGYKLISSEIGLNDSEFITRISGVIDKYPANYISQTQIGLGHAYKNHGYVAYGKYLSDHGGSHTLTIDGISATSKVEVSEDRIGSIYSLRNMLDINPTYYPGDSIPFEFEYSMQPSTYNRTKEVTEDYLENPTVHIRVPKGFTLEETKVQFSIGDKDVTQGAVLHSKITQADGTVLYKYIFDEKHIVMVGAQWDEKTNDLTFLTTKYSLKVDIINNGVASLRLRDIFMLEAQSQIIAYDSAIAYIRNDDFGLTENNYNLIVHREDSTFSVVKLPELKINSGIRVKGSGTDFYTYDGTESTVASLSKERIAEVEVSYLNASSNKFSDANIYFPVPKEGKEYGRYFTNKAIQDPGNAPEVEAFTWSANIPGEINVGGFSTLYAVDGAVNATEYTGGLTWAPFVPTTKWYTYAELAAAGFTNKDVVFMKFKNNAPINPENEGKFTFDLEADDDAPIDLTNYWRTYTAAQMDGASNINWVYGGVLAATLAVGKIEGFVFIDHNANGLYDVGTDEIYTGDDLVLSLTEKDGKISSTVLDITTNPGHYLVEMLKQGEYSVSAVNANNMKYHFTKKTANVGTKIGSKAVPNAPHTQGVISELKVDSVDGSSHTGQAIGLIENTPVAFEFENNVKTDASMSGLAKLTYNDETAEYNGELIADGIFKASEFGIVPRVILPRGYVHAGWQMYTVENGVEETRGGLIAPGAIGSTIVPTLASGTELIIKAVVVYPPIVTVNDLEKYVTDTFNSIEGVSATTAAGVPIHLVTEVGATNNTTVTHTIKVEDGKYAEAGTYEVVITVKDVSNGAYTTVSRKVKVNEGPTVIATPQVYDLGEVGIEASVKGNASASWLKASDTIDTAPTKVDTATTYEIITGPSTDFSKVGVYKVKYAASDNGYDDEITVDVVVKPVDSKKVGAVEIGASGFTLTQAEAKALLEAHAKDKAEVLAFLETKDDQGVTVGYEDITSKVTVDTDEINDIKAVDENGGFFPLTFSVTEGDDTAELTVNVVVSGKEVSTDGHVAIKASSFSIENLDAKVLNAELAKDALYANATALIVEDGTSLDGSKITVDSSELAAINAVDLAGDTLPLTFTVTHDFGGTVGTKSVDITVQVTVKPTKVAPTVTANGIDLYVGDKLDLVAGLKAVDATGANIIIDTDPTTGNTIITHSIAVTDDKVTTVGTYKVTYEVTDTHGNVGSKDIVVRVSGMPTVEAKGLAFEVGDAAVSDALQNNPIATWLKASLNVGEAASVETINTPAKPEGSGADIEYTIVYEDETTATTDLSRVGTYVVTYTAVNPDGKEGVGTSVLVITPDDPSNDLQLDVEKTIILENKDAKDFDYNKAIELAKAKAMLIEKDADGNITGTKDVTANIKVNEGTLKQIQEASIEGGTYTLVYSITENGVTVDKEVTVVIKGTSTINEDGLILSARGFVVKNDKAKDITISDVMSLGKVSASLEESGVAVTNITILQSDVDKINAVDKNGAYVDVTVNAKATINGVEVSKDVVIRVVVEGLGVIVGVDYSIYAAPYTLIGKDVAAKISDAELLILMNTKVSSNHAGQADGTAMINNFDDLKDVAQKYQMELAVVEEPATKGNYTVEVSDEDVVVVGDTYTIRANNFIIGLDDLEGADFVEWANAWAHKNDDETDTTDVKYVSGIGSTVGDYKAVYEVPAEAGLQAIVDVKVVPGTVKEGDKYLLIAENIKNIRVSKAKEILKDPSVIIEMSKSLAPSIEGSLANAKVLFKSTNLEAVAGKYTFTLYIAEEDLTITKTIEVVSGDAPVLNVEKVSEIDLDSKFNPLDGFTLSDDFDSNEDLMSNLVVDSNVDTSKVGIYQVTYTVTDSDDNTSVAVRTVIVGDVQEINDYYVHAISFEIHKDEVDMDNSDAQLRERTEIVAASKLTGELVDVSLVSDSNYTNVIGDYVITYVLDVDSSVSISPVATVTQDSVYYVDGADTEMDISDYNASRSANTLSKDLLEATNAQGWKYDENGVKQDVQVYVKNLEETNRIVKVGDVVQVELGLSEDDSSMARMTSGTTDIDEAIKTVNVKITSTETGKQPGTGQQPGTGIKANSLFNWMVLLLSSLYVLVVIKSKRGKRTV